WPYGGTMKVAFGGLLLAAAVVAAEAKADPGPDPAPARTSASAGSSRFHPVQVWGGIGYYNTSFSQTIAGVSVGGGTGQFGFNGGGSYAFPINPDLSALAFGNLALAFGDLTTFPITLGGGIRGEHRVAPDDLLPALHPDHAPARPVGSLDRNAPPGHGHAGAAHAQHDAFRLGRAYFSPPFDLHVR